MRKSWQRSSVLESIFLVHLTCKITCFCGSHTRCTLKTSSWECFWGFEITLTLIIERICVDALLSLPSRDIFKGRWVMFTFHSPRKPLVFTYIMFGVVWIIWGFHVRGSSSWHGFFLPNENVIVIILWWFHDLNVWLNISTTSSKSINYKVLSMYLSHQSQFIFYHQA